MSTLAVTNLKHESATGNNIVLDSSGNVAFADGSASAPSITNDGDTNTGIYFPAADNIGFATNGVIRGRWTTDGLCFGSDTAAANALDDYEEGTWSPIINGVTKTNGGWYTKIGRQVFLGFNNLVGITGIANNAQVALGGTPFTPSSYDQGGTVAISFNDESDSYKDSLLIGRTTNSNITFTNRSGVTTTTLDPFNMVGSFQII